MCIIPQIILTCVRCDKPVDISAGKGIRTNEGAFHESCFTEALQERDAKSPHGTASDMMKAVRDGMKEW